MDQKESIWLKKKIGCFSSSNLDLLMPGKGNKWTDTNKNYLYKIQRQRLLNEPAPPIHARTMDIGIQNEPYAIEWLRENTTSTIKHCDSDYPEKIFVRTEWGLGSSPDAYEVKLSQLCNEKHEVVYEAEKKLSLIEIKVTAGEETTNFYFSPTVPFDRKRMRAFDEHRDQMAGQLLTHPDIDVVKLMKYDPQLDDNEFDLRSPVDKTRGIVFEFTRAEFGTYLDTVEQRVRFADEYLKSGKDIELINRYWEIYLKEKQK